MDRNASEETIIMFGEPQDIDIIVTAKFDESDLSNIIVDKITLQYVRDLKSIHIALIVAELKRWLSENNCCQPWDLNDAIDTMLLVAKIEFNLINESAKIFSNIPERCRYIKDQFLFKLAEE